MGHMTTEVLALLQERQDRRKAEFDTHRRDVRFAVPVGDEVILDTEHAPLPSLRLLLSPRWMGPFKVLACPAPNTYRLDDSATWRIFPEFDVETSASLPARARRDGPARCRRGPGGRAGGAGAAQVPDALQPPARAGALGGPRRLRRLRRHVGLSWEPGAGPGRKRLTVTTELGGGPHRLRTSYRPRAASARAAASRRRRAAAAASADRFHRRRCPAGGPGRRS
jgi:hypothetical protein